MRKTAATVTVTTLVIGVFGAFLRWLQNANGFEKETGLPIPFHGSSIVFVIYCILAAAAIAVVTFGWLGRYACGKDVSALRSATAVPAALSWVLGIGFAAASCFVLFSSDYARYPTAQRLMGAFGILGGIAFPFLPGKTDGTGHGFGRIASAVAALFCCYWLLFCYRTHVENPVIWSYAVEMLAIAANAAAFYYVAAFHFGGGRGRRALLAVQLAVYLDVATIFDSRRTALTVMLLLAAAMLLLTEYLLIENMRDSQTD